MMQGENMLSALRATRGGLHPMRAFSSYLLLLLYYFQPTSPTFLRLLHIMSGSSP